MADNSEPRAESLEGQLTQINERVRMHANRLWQLPFAYLGVLGVVIQGFTATTTRPHVRLISGALMLVGILAAWAMSGAVEGIYRGVGALRETERLLRLPTTAQTSPYGQYLPYFLVLATGIAVAAATFWGTEDKMLSSFFSATKSGWALLVVFAGAWLTFYVMLIRVFKLGRVGWKRADYIWLGLAAAGLIGLARDGQSAAAERMNELFNAQRDSSYATLRAYVNSYGYAGAACQVSMTNPARLTRKQVTDLKSESASTCDWFRRVSGSLPKSTPRQRIVESAFPVQPAVKDPALADLLTNFSLYLSSFNTLADRSNNAGAANLPSVWEDALTMPGPFLIAIALALRLTKVTGELRLERDGQ